jgi:hypothetical protein
LHMALHISKSDFWREALERPVHSPAFNFHEITKVTLIGFLVEFLMDPWKYVMTTEQGWYRATVQGWQSRCDVCAESEGDQTNDAPKVCDDCLFNIKIWYWTLAIVHFRGCI